MSNEINSDIARPEKTITTPCVGICSTGIGGDVCRGCKRYAHEIIAWNSFTNEQKQAVEQRLQQLLTKVVAGKFTIIDGQALHRQMDELGFVGREGRNPYCHLFELIEFMARNAHETALAGVRCSPQVTGLGIQQQFELIDREFYILCEAHYERYFTLDRQT